MCWIVTVTVISVTDMLKIDRCWNYKELTKTESEIAINVEHFLILFLTAVTKGSGGDGLTGWAVVCRPLTLLKLFFSCQVNSDFYGTWYEWYEARGCNITEQILNICINYAN